MTIALTSDRGDMTIAHRDAGHVVLEQPKSAISRERLGTLPDVRFALSKISTQQ